MNGRKGPLLVRNYCREPRAKIQQFYFPRSECPFQLIFISAMPRHIKISTHTWASVYGPRKIMEISFFLLTICFVAFVAIGNFIFLTSVYFCGTWLPILFSYSVLAGIFFMVWINFYIFSVCLEMFLLRLFFWSFSIKPYGYEYCFRIRLVSNLMIEFIYPFQSCLFNVFLSKLENFSLCCKKRRVFSEKIIIKEKHCRFIFIYIFLVSQLIKKISLPSAILS